jgi:hypothetical protein
MNFIPDQKESKPVPYYEDAIKKEGWQGHRTEKKTARLKSELGESIGRLGGFVSGYENGIFHIDGLERPGLRLHYAIEGRPARLDIAALPTRRPSNRESSIRMALYMLKIGFDGLWFMQALSPGFAPLMPFMIADNEGNTISQLWGETSTFNKLLPPGGAEFEIVEGEEIK